jgi:hypothetical protein
MSKIARRFSRSIILSSFTRLDDGSHDSRQRLARFERQGAGRHERLRPRRPDPVSRQLADARRRGRQHRGQPLQSLDDFLLSSLGLAARLPVGILGLQEAKGIGQELVADRGGAGAVVAIEALDVARRELRIGDGGGEDLGVGRVGARHRDQALHRAVSRDLPGHDLPLHRW